MVVKDNFETIGLQSADGSKSLEGFVSDKDAFLVARIKAAGAIIIAKTNMAEFAFSPQETLSSLQGHTKNPYALDRVPAGSSGGTAASVAASFATAGLGSDTGNSIRGPSAHTALVGIRSIWLMSLDRWRAASKMSRASSRSSSAKTRKIQPRRAVTAARRRTIARRSFEMD
jgi:Asp-tRNA(Asn)/Glu-tRNA(Gln) amidotransferase A subunit family amidase